MKFPVHPAERTVLLDRTVVGYHLAHRYDEAVHRIAAMGIRPCVDGFQDRPFEIDEIYDWAEHVVETLGLHHEQRSHCYWCGRENGGNRLCVCYREVITQDYYDLRDRDLIQKLSPDTIITTSSCKTCGVPVPVSARVVQRFYAKNQDKTYRGRRFCQKHWQKKQKAAKKEPFNAAILDIKEYIKGGTG